MYNLYKSNVTFGISHQSIKLSWSSKADQQNISLIVDCFEGGCYDYGSSQYYYENKAGGIVCHVKTPGVF